MQTQLELNYDYSDNRFVIECEEEHESMLAHFIAAVSTGAIKISYVNKCYADHDLFKEIDEESYKHTYEELKEANPSFRTVQPLKPKSELLLELEEKAAATERNQSDDDSTTHSQAAE